MIKAKSKIKHATIHAVVIRADGTIEDKGMVAYQNSNIITNFLVNSYIKIRDMFR